MTLLELMAALGVVGLLLLGMRAVLAQLGSSGERIVAAATHGDARANGERMFRLLLVRAVVGTDSTRRFVGDDVSATFDTSCDTRDGWLERCRVTLGIAYRADSTVVVADSLGRPTIELLAVRGRAEFRYFNAAAADDTWVHGWGRNIALPGALGIVAGEDTLVFRTSGGP